MPGKWKKGMCLVIADSMIYEIDQRKLFKKRPVKGRTYVLFQEQEYKINASLSDIQSLKGGRSSFKLGLKMQ